uniref:Uncharacterized protein n=1 Tax=Tanacetum cinerariifolium TaxID=118510 RepID=A0A6L2KLF6_TANCI|nr:hypothetical protein [Tanacetum cinerariifolium]
MRRIRKGFSGRITPLFPTMVVQSQLDEDEAVHKELRDSLVRAATTTSSLEAEQNSDGGPRCQKAMGDTTAQTRIDSMVLGLEKTKTTQALEITSLKRRAKKLKKKQRSKTHKLKRLYKVGLIARVDSFEDEQSLGKDPSKQRRKINDINADEDITLVNDQDDVEMFDVSAAGEVNAASIATTINAAATITTKKSLWLKHLWKFQTELVEGSSKRAREELTQESAKKQKLEEAEKKTGSTNPAHWRLACPEVVNEEEWNKILTAWMTEKWKKCFATGVANRKKFQGMKKDRRDTRGVSNLHNEAANKMFVQTGGSNHAGPSISNQLKRTCQTSQIRIPSDETDTLKRVCRPAASARSIPVHRTPIVAWVDT